LDPILRTGPFLGLVWQLALYTFLTTWVTIVLTSVLGCIFIRFTATSPGLYPSHGLKAALLMYRVHRLNAIQTQWTWTITGQYLRALAGMRFERVGGSECDVMNNLVPELATADAQVFWSKAALPICSTMPSIKLRQLDLPHSSFRQQLCAEYGHLPSNFLLGVSTPSATLISGARCSRGWVRRPSLRVIRPSGLQARKWMDMSGDMSAFRFFLRGSSERRLASGWFRSPPSFFMVLYVALERSVGYPVAAAFAALVLAEIGVVVLCITVKKMMVGKKWGADHSTPFWSWRHFAYFFAQDCFFVWCREPLRFFAGTTAANSILRWMGCRIGERTIVTDPMQCCDWNAVSFGSDCYVAGFLQFPHLRRI
jgi:hypothetical protein